MKAMRVMILAAAMLTGCGPGVDEQGAAGDYAAAERGLTQGCDELNCQERRTFTGPGDPSALPQDPVPLHTGRTAPAATSDLDVLKAR